VTTQNTNVDELIGQVVLKLAQLPKEDLPLVVEFINYLTNQRQTVPPNELSIAEIRAEARRRANELSQIPRTEIVSQFQRLAEEIRQITLTKNTSVEGDWLSD